MTMASVVQTVVQSSGLVNGQNGKNKTSFNVKLKETTKLNPKICATNEAVVTKIPRPVTANKLHNTDSGKAKPHPSTIPRNKPAKTPWNRKSLSLMDFSKCYVSPAKKYPQQLLYQRSSSIKAISSSSTQNCVMSEQSLVVNDQFSPEADSRIAGLKIFASIMLNAWRHRREDVRRLSDEISRMQKVTINTKNQLHVIKSVFKIEERRNDELTRRIKEASEVRAKIEGLLNQSKEILNDRDQRNMTLERLLSVKTAELEGLNAILIETKSDLFQAIARERNVAVMYSSEQKRVLALENNKNELLNQISSNKTKHLEEVNSLKARIDVREDELSKCRTLLDTLENKLNDLKCKELQCQEYEQTTKLQENLIEQLQNEIKTLKSQIDSTLQNQVKRFIYVIPYQTLRCLHILAFLLLPTVPVPQKLPNKNLIMEAVFRICQSLRFQSAT